MYLAEPSKRFVPDLVMTLTIAPCARPYSAEAPEVYTDTSWIASKFRFVPNVPVVGSVVSTASMMNRLLLVSAPSALTLPVPTTPGDGADERLIAAADGKLLELLAAHARVGRGVGRVDDRRFAEHLHGVGQRADASS